MRESGLWLSLLLVLAAHAHASTVIPIDVATQIDQSELIFIGTVIGIESVPVRDGSFAYTYVTFDVEETLKGVADGPTFTLRMAGGEVPPLAYEIAGAPKFRKGGRHVLFVVGNDRYGIPLSGGPQGKLDLVAHPVTQELIVTDDAGRAIDGVRAKGFVRGGMKLGAHGQLQRPRPAAAVLSEEGVKIELDAVEAQNVEDAAPAAKVIGELRALIQSRTFAPEFRRGGVVASASPANVPATHR